MEKASNILKKPITAIFLSILLGFIIGAIALAAAGYNPIESYIVLFKGIFGKPRYMVQTVIMATPVIITGLSVTFAFKTGLFNIGAEGQFMMGAITAAFLGYNFHFPEGMPFILANILHPIVVMLGAMVVASLYGGFVGLLKVKFGIHEVLTSIMLNWVALYLNNFYVSLPQIKKPGSEASYEVLDTARIVLLRKFRDPSGVLENLKDSPTMLEIFSRTDLNLGIIIAIIAAVVVWFILNKTTLGCSLKAVGFNKDAAEFAGINVKKNMILSMAIAGAIAGLAGAVYITGMNPHRVTTLAIHENYGFNGLSVALIGNLNPFGCILAGLLFGGLNYGGRFIQSELGAPSEIINIMIGVIVFFIGMKTLFTIAADQLKKKGAK